MNKILLLFFLFFSGLTYSQEFSFSVFNESNGITRPYIYSIRQNPEGFLCFTTSEGAFKFDGISFQRIDKKEEIKEPFFKSILVASDHSIFLGSNTGGIYKYVKGEMVLRIKSDKNTNPVISLIEKDQVIYALFQNGEIQTVKNGNKSTSFQLEEGHLYTRFEIFQNSFVVSHESGIEIFQLSKDKITNQKSINVNDDEVVSVCVNKETLFLGTASNGLYAYTDKRGLKKINLGKDINSASIKAICYDELSSIWISVEGVGVFEIKRNSETGIYYRRSELKNNKGLPSEYITDIFIDREANMWLGTYGQGLIKLNSNFLVKYNLRKYGLGEYVYSISGDTKQYCGMENGVVVIDALNDSIYPWPYNKQLPKDRISAVAYDNISKTLYIGTKDNGLFYLKEGDKKISSYYLSEDNLSKGIRHLNVVNSNVYVSTLNGLYELNLKSGRKKYYSAADGLPHNTINSTFLKSDGKLLIATVSSGIFYLQDDKIQEAKKGQDFGMLDVLAFVEDRKGGIWMATNGQGLLHLQGDELSQLNKETGLFSNFIYQLSLDKKNTIWCGHKGGLSRVNMNEKVVQLFDKKNNIRMDFNSNASNNDVDNNLWFGTNEGVLQFSLFHDKFSTEEIIPILISANIKDKVLKNTEKIYLPYSRNELKVTFRAISLSNPGKVYYQYRLKDLEDTWSSPSQENYAEFAHLPDNNYVLEVRSRIGNGEWSKAYALTEISVRRPIWKEWWFMLSLAIIIIGLVALMVNYRTRSLKRQKDDLERKLAIRTKEIEQQKNQIKLQFTETQDSINYAVRIQKSLLPDESHLKEIMPDSFIFIQPKDKVSGDFYYFQKFNNRVIVSAADATGHGVPGAFISLIGFTSLKEIVNRETTKNPADVLTALDLEINHTLHQYNGPTDGKDGMDMAICEIDMDSLKIRMASALRPIWIFHKGQFEKIRSSKSSIGGGMEGHSMVGKEFDLEERQMDKGDTIYMFSDGYVDQFGSELNKKLMSKRFLHLLKEKNHLPMIEQRVIISNFLNDWKGDFEQTDDILVIGIRL